MPISRPVVLALVATVLVALTFLVGVSAREQAIVSEPVAQSVPPAPEMQGEALSTPGELDAQARKQARAKKAEAPKPATPAAKAKEPKATAPARATETQTRSKPAAEPQRRPRAAGVPRPVLDALQKKQILVLLVTGKGADDTATRQSLRSVRSMKGVAIFSVPVKRVDRYSRVIQNLNVSQAPAIAIVDRKRQARLIEGFFDGGSLRQAVMDAR